MMLSYAKHPELRLLDEDECQKVLNTDYRRNLFGMFYHYNESDGTYLRYRGVVRDGNIPQFGNRDGMMKEFVKIEKEYISSGLYANLIDHVYYVPKSFTSAHVKIGDKLKSLATIRKAME